MSFIAYAINLDNTCKLLSNSRMFALSDESDKNRIYCTGTSCMSTKLTVSLANSRKLCEDLRAEYVFDGSVRRDHFLERQPRVMINGKMKSMLNAVVELQSKYIDLPEFKKNSCLTVDQAVPKIKMSASIAEEDLSDSKAE